MIMYLVLMQILRESNMMPWLQLNLTQFSANDSEKVNKAVFTHFPLSDGNHFPLDRAKTQMLVSDAWLFSLWSAGKSC
jgi:hypothetical protein